MEHPTTNGNAMMQYAVHPCGVTFFLGLMLFGAGCGGTPPAGTGIPESQAQAATPIRDREQEVRALRAEMAATRIAAAKKEAELLELRDLVRQLRLENAESRQAFLDLREQAEQRQRDMDKMQEGQERQAQAHTTQDLSVLKETVVTLTQELSQLRRDLSNPVSSPSSAISPVALTVTDAVFLRKPPATITVQPGDTLASLARRHRITVEVLRSLNALNGDTLIVGRELVLPKSR
jgi:LysM repeat protein